jgi:hypothetical protein
MTACFLHVVLLVSALALTVYSGWLCASVVPFVLTNRMVLGILLASIHLLAAKGILRTDDSNPN